MVVDVEGFFLAGAKGGTFSNKGMYRVCEQAFSLTEVFFCC